METAPKKYSDCLDPLLIRRTSTNLITGEIKTVEFDKRCGTRRRDKCEPCSVIWKDDAYYALINPSKEHQGSLTFITLTAPGSKHFGASHTASYKGLKSERCACRSYHSPSDKVVGLPINPENFEYKKITKFNYRASRLTSVTLQKIYRLMLTDLNNGKDKTEKKTIKDVRLPTARVMEWQERGVLHVHIIVRGHVPTYIVEKAVKGSPATATRRRVLPAEHDGEKWGSQFDVRHINSGDEKQLAKLGGYVTKVVGYALKDVTAHGAETDKKKEAFHSRLRKTTNTVVQCEKSFSECDASQDRRNTLIISGNQTGKFHFCVKHRRAHHQLGFTGNVLTLNKAWGSSLKKAREARIAFASSHAGIKRNAVKAGRIYKEKNYITHVVLKKRNLLDYNLLAFKNNAPTVNVSEMFVSSRT
jgi:hypothetical protein